MVQKKEDLPVKISAPGKPLKFDKGDESAEGSLRKVTIPGDRSNLLKMKMSLGSDDVDFVNVMANQIYLSHPSLREEHPCDILNKITPVLHAIKPRDEFEGIMATQIVSTHNLAMEMMSRAAQREDQIAIESAVNLATKLTRSFITLVDGLDKHRYGRQQKMTVEHVHVNEGGQAIVGNVKQGGEGGKEK